MTDTRSVLYVAASDDDATAGAEALESAASGLSVTAAVDLERIRERAPAADCAVFAETPTTAPGSHLLDVIDAAGSTPVVLFSAPSYRPTTARSTDGIAGYVRRGDGPEFAHLADEIEWVCHDRETDGSATALSDVSADAAAGTADDAGDGGALTTDRQGRITAVDEWVAAVLDVDADGLVGVPLSALAAGGAVTEADGQAIVAAVERVLDGETDRVDLESAVTPDGEAEVPVTLSVTARDGDGIVRVRPRKTPPSGRSDAAVPQAADDPETGSAPAVESDGGDTVAQPLGPADPADLGGPVDGPEDRSPLFGAVPDPAISYELVDGEPLVRAINDAFEAVFDPPGEIRGENLLEHVRPPGGDATTGPLSAAFAAEEHRELSVRLLAGDGLRTFALRIVPDPRCGTAVAICTDVTERRRRRRELAIRNDRLDELATVVRHGLRNSLNLAQGYLELAVETGEMDYLETVETGHDRIADRVARAAELTRRSDRIVDPEPVALQDAARRAWATIDADDATLALEDEADAIVSADKRGLVELLEHCFRRAVDRGGEDLTVRVDATEDGFAVVDDGPAPPAIDRAGVLESPVDSAAPDAPIELTAADRVALAHGWTVSVEEREGGGTRIALGTVERGTVEGPDRGASVGANVENES